MAFPKSEYHHDTFSISEKNYIIGTARGEEFIAEEIVFYATEDCYVRFEDDTNWMLIPKEVYFEWYRRTGTIAFRRVSVNGTLHIWSEGHTAR